MGPWLLLATACKETNPDFDGPAESGSDTGPSSTSTESEPTTGPTSTGPVATSEGTTGSSGEPGTSSGEPGTSSGEPGESTTGCDGMICSDVCIDPMTNPDNCGECDNKCVGQQECIDGNCMMP